MDLNNYQTILTIELNNGMCYSRHHLMVPGDFYCWVAGSFKRGPKGLTPWVDLRCHQYPEKGNSIVTDITISETFSTAAD